MALIDLKQISLTYDTAQLFDEINLTVNEGDRIGLIGRNGSGKSSLLKLMDRQFPPDSGTVATKKGIRSAFLDQMVPGEMPGTVYDIVRNGINPEHDNPTINHEQDYHRRTGRMISELDLTPSLVFNDLSAGMKRKVLMAKAFISEPDILLLDEPTNHMDIDSIAKLEDRLQKFKGAIIMVTHDRVFLQKIARRIVEIDRGRIFDQTCDYQTFLERRATDLESEEIRNALFDRKLKQEEAWVRQGIKARRTRNEGRVRELIKMREIRAERRSRTDTVRITEQRALRSGNLVVDAQNVAFSYGEKTIISGLSTMIMKGDKVGILGPNGSGKTTLLRLLLGELGPDTGRIKLGTNLQVAYFDQLREQLDEDRTVQENIAEDNIDMVFIDGQPRHIVTYLQDFLFSPEQVRSYVRNLSGGERNRLLLARLFTRPSNIMVLDEPTNDLDIETLEILEDYLTAYKGTIILVSHDREFINNIVTSTLVFEGNGRVKEYVGGYDDWIRQRRVEDKPAATTPVKVKEKQKNPFGYKQQRELELIPELIMELEAEQARLFKEMSSPDLYKKEDKAAIVDRSERFDAVKEKLAVTYARWEELEKLKEEAGI